MGDSKEAGETPGLRATHRGTSLRLRLFGAALASLALSAAALFLLVYVPNERREAIAGWVERLEAVANDRNAAVDEWIADNLRDARTAASSPSVRAAVAARRAGSAFVAADRLDEALSSLQSGRRHGGSALFGEGGIWLGGSGRWGSKKEVEDVARLLGTQAAVDFLLGADGAPLVVFSATVPGGGEGARAVILVDPAEWLYPLLAREAVPTRTGEVLLARLDGRDLVVLSPLRTRPDSPLKLRIPASGPALGARLVTTRKEMAGEFPDYRGEPVEAAGRLVPGTGWVLVAKVDREEALALFRAKMRWAAALLSFTIVLGGLLAAALVREAGNRFRRAAAASNQRLAFLLKEANDAILYSAADGAVLEANPRAEELYGYSRAELLTMSLRDLRPPEGRVELDRQLAAIWAGAPPVFETNVLRKDGTAVEVEESVRLTSVEGKPGFTSVIRDVSARKESERRIVFLNRMLRTHTAVNQLIIRERDQQRLFDGVCRAAVDVAGFRMAWIGLADRTAGSVRPAAVAGHDDGYLSATSIRCDETMEGRGPTGTAIRERRTVTLDDTRDDPRLEPGKSSAALPLLVDGEAIGALTVYSDERAAFTGEIVALLEELASDLAFALQVTRAEEAHRQVEERYRHISENAADVIWILDVATRRFTYVSPSIERLRGFTPEEVIDQPVESALIPESRQLITEELPRRIAAFEAGDESERTAITQMDQLRRDGTVVPTEVATTLLTNSQGRVVEVLGVTRDVSERKRAEEELRESEERFSGAFNDAPIGMGLVLPDGRWFKVNRALCDLVGYSEAELLTRTFQDITHPEDLDIDLENVRRIIAGEIRTYAMEKRYVHARGHSVAVLLNVSLIRDGQGRPLYFVAQVQDITERKAAERTITHLNRVYAMLSGINTLIVRVRDTGELFREACRIAVEGGGFRMALIGLVDRTTLKMVSIVSAGKDDALLAAIRNRLASKEDARNTMVAEAIREKKAVVANDSQSDPRVVFPEQYLEAGVRSMAVLPLIVSDEAVGVIALYARESDFFLDGEMKLLTELAGDVAFAIDHIEKQKRLDYLAYYDVLTGLANRALFRDRVAQHIRAASSGGHQLAVGLIDLERFKSISDTFGRLAGDALLRQVAEWLTRIAGDATLLARIGADHFAAVLPEVKREGDVALLVEKSLEALKAHPFRLDAGVFRIAARVGIALFPDDGADAETLLRKSEAALKKAKASGDRHLFFRQEMTEAVAGRVTLEHSLRVALEKGEFVLHYQPTFSLASGKLTSAEALIRWDDPRTGLVPPGQFIPILEEIGLIHEVGRWALRTAVEDHLRWRAAGLPAVRIAVNVSPLQLRRRSFVDEIREVVGMDAHAAAGLALEITEGLIMEDVKHSIASLQAIRAMGVSVAIDDFGTGFSSLAYLAKLPVDTLKIDRSFVNDMTAGPEGTALVSTIIDLAHSLKLNVVAEGVETEEQSRLLGLLKCDEMQGFLRSKPLPRELFEARFLTSPPADAGLG